MNVMSKVPVCLTHCSSYEIDSLMILMQEQLNILGVPADLSASRILLKPNLISAMAPSLACSSPFFTAAAARCFIDRGAKVILGDSPAFGSAARALKRQGFKEVLSNLAVEYIPFSTRVLKKLDCGIEVGVAAEALDCDYFINLPRIKAHDQMAVTMAVKNTFGIVLGARKAWYHMRHGESHQIFAQMILDLQKLLPETIVLSDGIEVMNKRGPMKGTSLSIGCLAASKNAVAHDRAMLEVLEVDKKRVPLAVAADNDQLPGAHMSDLEFPQCDPGAFSGSGFRIPGMLSDVRFLPSRYLRSFVKRIVSR